ncbi:hypothetical protein EZV62_005232 [Acer yangbiense]|uniref:Uncharacterized protein n=1 Tax=Acer yangbiense TaxID=1000413 RepID=A0A5C7ILL3_9ROSI|nr:hypothetical protein EZV62_005232 [Acer yangbiense]
MGCGMALACASFILLMGIDPNVDSMEESNDSGLETLENSSSIGKGNVSKKGVLVGGGRKGKENQNVGYISKNVTKEGMKRARCKYCGDTYAFD